MAEHGLQWKQALPIQTPPAKVYDVLEQGRRLLKRLSGDDQNIQFRHMITEEEATIGGPLGEKIRVIYIQLFARFSKPDFALPPETQVLLRQYRMDVTNRDVNEAAAKAMADRRKELEKQAKEAIANQKDPVRDNPDAITMKAKDVQLDKMLISDLELARVAETPAGVSIFDGPMVPGTDEEVN